MKKRVLLTGARGFVAGSILWQAPPEWEVHAVSRGEPVLQRPGIVWHHVNDPADEVPRHLCDFVAPHVILHTAAIADIDRCEADHTLADRVNTAYPAALANWAGRHDARLVFLSTDNVFDGIRGAYRESDIPNPVNYYGRTKAAAEKAVLDAAPNAVAARVALVMGLPILGQGNSFLARMIPELRAGRTLGVPPTEIRAPIDVVTLGKALWELVEHPFTGILHLAGNDTVGRLDMVRRIAQHLGFSTDLVVPNDPTVIPGRAERPVDASLDNGLARATLSTSFCGLEEGVDRVMRVVEETKTPHHPDR